MADRGRDLTFNLVTDQSQFDTDQAARDMQQLGDAAQDTGRQQQQLGDDATRAAGDLERLATQAEQAGRAVRDAGTDATSARGDLGQLDEAAEATGGAFGDMRDEAGAALMETAGSFDGTMTGLIDGVQGALPALGAALGGVGLLVGSAAAAGVGFLKAQTEALKESASALTSELIAGGGRLSRDSLLGKLEEYAADGRLVDLAEQARKAKVPVADFLAASAGDPGAIERTTTALDRRRDSLYDVEGAQRGYADSVSAMDREQDRQAIEAATDAMNSESEARRLATEAVEAYDLAVSAASEQAEQAAEAQGEYASALAGVSDEAGAMADAITEGIDAVIEAQDRSLSAMADFETNTTAVFERVGEAGVQWALDQGENAEEAMQLLADAPLEKAQLVAANYESVGRRAGSQVVAALLSQAAAAEAAGAELIRRVQVGLNSRPLEVRTKLDPTGYDAGVRTMIRNGRVAV